MLLSSIVTGWILGMSIWSFSEELHDLGKDNWVIWAKFHQPVWHLEKGSLNAETVFYSQQHAMSWFIAIEYKNTIWVAYK